MKQKIGGEGAIGAILRSVLHPDTCTAVPGGHHGTGGGTHQVSKRLKTHNNVTKSAVLVSRLLNTGLVGSGPLPGSTDLCCCFQLEVREHLALQVAAVPHGLVQCRLVPAARTNSRKQTAKVSTKPSWAGLHATRAT